MKKTKCTGGVCVGDLRLAPLDVGLDIRLHDTPLKLPEHFNSVGLERDGETWLIEGTREEMIQAIRDAGYKIAE